MSASLPGTTYFVSLIHRPFNFRLADGVWPHNDNGHGTVVSTVLTHTSKNKSARERKWNLGQLEETTQM